jgi:hypothetical protein
VVVQPPLTSPLAIGTGGGGELRPGPLSDARKVAVGAGLRQPVQSVHDGAGLEEGFGLAETETARGAGDNDDAVAETELGQEMAGLGVFLLLLARGRALMEGSSESCRLWRTEVAGQRSAGSLQEAASAKDVRSAEHFVDILILVVVDEGAEPELDCWIQVPYTTLITLQSREYEKVLEGPRQLTFPSFKSHQLRAVWPFIIDTPLTLLPRLS